MKRWAAVCIVAVFLAGCLDSGPRSVVGILFSPPAARLGEAIDITLVFENRDQKAFRLLEPPCSAFVLSAQPLRSFDERDVVKLLPGHPSPECRGTVSETTLRPGDKVIVKLSWNGTKNLADPSEGSVVVPDDFTLHADLLRDPGGSWPVEASRRIFIAKPRAASTAASPAPTE